MLFPDRLLGAFFALFKASVPRLDYFTTYRAKVVKQQLLDGSLDVVPDDPRVPSMAAVPLRHGVPGLSVKVPGGSYVLVGWSGGDPSQPFCCLWEGAEPTIELSLVANQIFIGDKSASGGGTLLPILDGVVHGRGVDPFTGLPYSALGSTSSVVAVKK